MRLGVLTSHPIQYQAPWFRALAKEVDLEVFFAHRQSAAEQGKAGFGVAFDWDVDLLSGYRHRFLKNVSARPGVDHFSGCDTPEIGEIIRGKIEDRSWKIEVGDCAQSPISQLPTPISYLPSSALSRFDAFIVTGWYLKSYRQAVRACRRAGVPVLVRGDSQLRTPRSRLKRFAMEIRQRWLLWQFDGFLTVGKRNREYLEHYGVPPEKIFFAPHFVDNEWFAARATEVRKQKLEVRRQWGARDEDLVALFVGKFQPIKRPQDLLRAMVGLKGRADLPVGQDASQRVPTVVAVFVGAGELEKDLRAVAAQEKLRVHFAGFKNQSELPRHYAVADVLVLPSESETWGLVVNEAMACGLPAIVSNAVGCAPDLIEEGKTGFTYPVSDCAEFARRLESLAGMKARGHNFTPALMEKMRAYSVAAAVRGTVEATRKAEMIGAY